MLHSWDIICSTVGKACPRRSFMSTGPRRLHPQVLQKPVLIPQHSACTCGPVMLSFHSQATGRKTAMEPVRATGLVVKFCQLWPTTLALDPGHELPCPIMCPKHDPWSVAKMQELREDTHTRQMMITRVRLPRRLARLSVHETRDASSNLKSDRLDAGHGIHMFSRSLGLACCATTRSTGPPPLHSPACLSCRCWLACSVRTRSAAPTACGSCLLAVQGASRAWACTHGCLHAWGHKAVHSRG